MAAATSPASRSASAAGIDLPYTNTQVLFHDQTEKTDGDRSRQREGWPAGRNPPRDRWQVARERKEADGEERA